MYIRKILAAAVLISAVIVTLSCANAENFVFLKDEGYQTQDFKIDFVYPQSMEKFIKSANCDKKTTKWLKDLEKCVVFYTDEHDYLIVNRTDAEILYDFEDDRPLETEATVNGEIRKSHEIGSNTAYYVKNIEVK